MQTPEQIVQKWLAAPLPIDGTEDGQVDDQFNPWEDLGLYGCYSAAFDDLAIAVLTDMRDGTCTEKSLAGEMFRELLCKQDLCEYGTSPRVCFPWETFRDSLPAILEKWKALRAILWGDGR